MGREDRRRRQHDTEASRQADEKMPDGPYILEALDASSCLNLYCRVVMGSFYGRHFYSSGTGAVPALSMSLF